MFDVESADNIEMFNAISGMRHRGKPYDLTNPEDLKQAFLLTVAACMDYRRYWFQLLRIEEETDESLEHYDTATWLNMNLAPEKTDSLIMEAIGSLNETSYLFRMVAERAERNCALILKAVLSSPPDTQKSVLGQVYSIPKKELDARIAELFEGLLEVDLHYNMQENRDEFLALMKNMWGNNGVE